MPSTTGERLGAAGDITGFVIAEDQGFRARLGRAWEQEQQDMAARASRFAAFAREKTKAHRVRLTALWAGLPIGRTPVAETLLAPRRGRRFAAALALHWRFRTLGMNVADSLGRISRFRLGASALVVLGGLAIGAALFLPDGEPAAAVALPVEAAPATAAATSLADLRPVALPARSVPTVSDLLPAKTEVGWQAVKRPFLVYNLEAPEVEAGDLVHRVAMRGRDARQDVMNWTAPAARKSTSARPAVHLVIERFEKAVPLFRPLYSDLAARAAEQGVSIERMNVPGEFPTKFGGVEVADAVLQTEQGALGCLVFRRIDTIGLVVAGWYCGTAQRPADRVSLTCFIDRLDLVGAGQDAALKKHFASAERNRRSCAGARQSGRKLTWLDHEAPLPALKLSAKAPQAK